MISLEKTRVLAIMALAMLTLFLGTGCIRKSNPTGNNWSDVYPLSFADSTSFIAGYSFAGSGTVKGTETNLLCGKYEGIESVTLLRFTGLPKAGDFSIPGGYQDSTWLELTLVKRSPLIRYPVELKVYKLNQSWAADSTQLVQDANLSLITPVAFTIPDTVAASGTSVKIPIPMSEIEAWTSSADTLGFSLAIRSGDESYAEILSAESGRGPKLRFLYRLDTDDAEADDRVYEQRPTRDSYRVDSDAAPLLSDRWVVANISPSRIYVNFAMDYTKFRDVPRNGQEIGLVLTEVQRKRATINKAELVLHVKSNPYYKSSSQYSLRGDRVRDSLDLTVPVEIADDKVASGIISQAIVRGDSVVVNITPLIQAYSSGDSEPWGVVIRSMHEMLNFGRLEFWHFTDAPANKKPTLRVTYTPPFL